MALTQEQREIVFATLRWARIYNMYVKYVPEDRIPTDIDADHSSLLWRLIKGEEPYKEVPPIFMGYPDIKAMEGKERDTRLGKGHSTPHIPNPNLET